MSTFYEYKDKDGDKITVYDCATGLIAGIDNDEGYNNILILKEDAPALALAVLEVAGYKLDADEFMDQALDGLRLFTTAQKQDEEKEALLAEAKALYEYSDPSWAQHRPWDPKAGGANVWVRAAQKAREIHTAKEEAK